MRKSNNCRGHGHLMRSKDIIEARVCAGSVYSQFRCHPIGYHPPLRIASIRGRRATTPVCSASTPTVCPTQIIVREMEDDVETCKSWLFRLRFGFGRPLFEQLFLVRRRRQRLMIPPVKAGAWQHLSLLCMTRSLRL